MKRLSGKCFLITLLVMVSTVGYHADSSKTAASSAFFALNTPVSSPCAIPAFLYPNTPAAQFSDVHHTEITASKSLLLNVEKPSAVTAQTIMPLRLISSVTSLKELLLQQQIHHKLSILNALSDCHFAQKILLGCYTLGLGMMRC
jgi:hypothetical protein